MVREEIFCVYAILIKENYPTKTALNFLGLFNFSRLLCCLLFVCADDTVLVYVTSNIPRLFDENYFEMISRETFNQKKMFKESTKNFRLKVK